MLKLFEFSGAETDWVAAHDEAEARRVLKAHHGISDEDIAESYQTISEVDPTMITCTPDDWDYDAEDAGDAEPPTALDEMRGKVSAFFLGSTCT